MSSSEGRASVPTPNELLLALVLAYGLGLFGALAGVPNQVEHEPHLFIADHYFQHFFDLWEPRWYGGFLLVGHPPLAHQLIALVARVPGLNVERAYAIVCVATSLGLVGSVWRCMEALWAARLGARIALIVAAYPLIYVFLFPLGQVPFILGCALGFAGASAFIRRTDGTDRWLEWAGGVCAGAAAICCHPLAASTFFLGLLLAALNRRAPLTVLLGALAGVGALAAWVCLPFWTTVLSQKAPGVPLAKLGAPWIIWTLGACILLAATATMVWAGSVRDRVLPVLAVLGWFAAITGPWPFIAEDKLLWWAGLAALLGLAPALWSSAPMLRRGVFMGVALLGLVTAAALGRPTATNERHRRTALREVADFLRRPGNERWRYVTLGIGSARFELLRRASIGSLDGGMPWISPPLLRGTQFFSLDELALSEKAGEATLQRMLDGASEQSLRWVISADERADVELKAHGYEVRSALRDRIVLWSKDSVPPIGDTQRSPSENLAWSLMPLTLLAAGLLLSLAPSAMRRRQSKPSLDS